MKHEYTETWTGREDALMLRLIDRHGPTWKIISRCMPNRTVSSIRNRYLRIVAGRQTGGKNKCRTCGQIKRGHTCRMGYDCESIAPGVTTDGVRLPNPVPNTKTEQERATETTDKDEKEYEAFPEHLFCCLTVQTVHDMGFDEVKHPPPLVQGFPFVTSLP